MKTICIFLALLTISHRALGDQLIPSALDPTFSEAREKVFIPWSTSDQAGEYWQKLAKDNVPIYKEFKPGGLSRDLYIPNPGIAYYVLGGLSEETFWKIQAEKLKIGDELVSASVYKDETGASVYWALWAPSSRAYLLVAKMRELGISHARMVK